MAEQTSNAQNKMGELFIDIGSSGINPMIKQLGKLSLGLFAAKKTADFFLKPIKQIQKETGANVVGLKKMSVELGATFQEVHKLRTYLSQKGLSEGLISDLGGLQDKLYDISHGFAGIDAQMARTMNMLGLNIMDYDGSLESTIRLVKDVQKATKGMSALDVSQVFRNLGLTKEFAYAIQRGDFDLSKALSISDADVENMLNTKESWDKLKTDWENRLMQVGVEVLPKLAPIAESLSKNLPTFATALTLFANKAVPVLSKFADAVVSFVNSSANGSKDNKHPHLSQIGKGTNTAVFSNDKNKKNIARAKVAAGAAAGAAAGSIIPGVGTAIGAVGGGILGGTAGLYAAGSNNELLNKIKEFAPVKEVRKHTVEKQQQPEKISIQMKEIPNTDNYDENKLPPKPKGLTGGAAPIEYSKPKLSDIENIFKGKHPNIDPVIPALSDYNALDSLPSNVQKNIANDITVNNTNTYNISSTDPQGAANAIHQLDSESMSLIFQQATQQAYAL